MGEPALKSEDWDDTWHEDEIWRPEEETIVEEKMVQQQVAEATHNLPDIPRIRPSQFTKGVFMMPKEDGTGYAPFSFDDRRHMIRIYDTPAKNVLLCCGRQVEKSTLLGNTILSYMTLAVGLRALYVSPSSTQTKTFSNDRIKEAIETSPILTRFTTAMLAKNIFEKQFVNRSLLTLRYAYLNADRTRGIPAWQLYLDEIQDILRDNIPVIEHCLSHAPEMWKRKVYSGTPKSLDNIIEEYRGDMSTQTEWMVPCDCTGGEGGRHWNILDEGSIGKKGPICTKCGKLIHPQGPESQWVHQIKPDPTDVNKVPWESYRIPQLMVPWKIRNWHEVLYDYENHPRAQFMNEVMGRSYESGLRPITQAQLRDACGTHRMADLEKVRALSLAQPFFAGVDWGTGDRGYTILTISTYVENRFRVLFMKRFVGEEADPGVQIHMIIEMCRHFNVALIGCDYGFGFGMNHHLVREFGAEKVHTYQYIANFGKKVEFDPKMGRWKVNRTDVMSGIFEAIKKKKCEFPHWDDFQNPFAKDFINIYSEYNDRLRMIQYDHKSGNPDDSFHSFLYSWIVSMLLVPRPDIIAPTQEDSDGNHVSQYQGPVSQG